MRLFASILLAAGYILCGCTAPVSHNGSPATKVDLLEADMGGATALMNIFSTEDEVFVRELLDTYGIGYQVHDPYKMPAGVETDDKGRVIAKYIGDCPQYFPSSDRNTWHAFNGEYYYIDSSGRPQRAYKYMPPIASEPRWSSCQTSVGRWGDAENPSNDYDGGHIIGSQLGGWGGRANLVPQDLNFNRGNWLQIENQMARCDGLPRERMFYYIRLSYSGSSTLIPGTFSLTLEDRVDGDSASFGFQNVDYGGSNGTANRRRAVDFLSDQGCN